MLTRNHQGIINAVEKFEGRKYNYEPINAVEQRLRLQADAGRDRDHPPAGDADGAIRGLCTKLGSLREGRKSLILVSEGFNATAAAADAQQSARRLSPAPATSTRDPFAGENNMMEDRAQFSAEHRHAARAAGRVRRLQPQQHGDLRASIRAAWRVGEFDITANISMRTSQAYLNASIDTLRELADNTDGRAIVNRNDLAAGMKQIIRDSSAYYLVGYNSTQAPTDGKFHEIKVRVKRPGVQVRARKGYWAYTADDVEARGRGTEAGPAGRDHQGAGRDCADDQPPLHPHLDRQRQGRGRQDARHAAVGAAAADARRAGATSRGASRVLATVAVGRHRLSRPRADRAGHARQRRHRPLRGAARQARSAADDRRRRHRHARHRRSRRSWCPISPRRK